ncbi:MAG: hypothetical protein U0R44_01070 [Candidatus Micrarchaeia archaeon]
MKTLFHRSSIVKASMLIALPGCISPKQNPPIVEIPRAHDQMTVPEVPAPAKPAARLIPTKMTVLFTGRTLMAYVSVPQDGGMRDLEDANSDFFYLKGGSVWTPIPDCQHVFTCDSSGVVGSNPMPIKVRAVFASEGYASSSGDFTIHGR